MDKVGVFVYDEYPPKLLGDDANIGQVKDQARAAFPAGPGEIHMPT